MTLTIDAKIKLSKDFYAESYNQYSRFGSKRLLIERAIGTVALVGGVYLWATDFHFDVLVWLLFAVALVDLLGYWIRKFFWMRRCTGGKSLDTTVEFELTESGISSSSKYSTGHLSWDGVEKVRRTEKGLIVWPQKGIYMYFPEAMVGVEPIDYICDMVP